VALARLVIAEPDVHNEPRERRAGLPPGGSTTPQAALVAVGGLWVHRQRTEVFTDGPVISRGLFWPDDGTDDGLGGTLDMADGCIRVGEAAVVWPAGTSWDADDRAVVTPEGHHLSDGDSFDSGVGYLPMSQDDFLTDDAVARALGDCEATEVVVLVDQVQAR
jgi:hypothetical protein